MLFEPGLVMRCKLKQFPYDSKRIPKPSSYFYELDVIRIANEGVSSRKSKPIFFFYS